MPEYRAGGGLEDRRTRHAERRRETASSAADVPIHVLGHLTIDVIRTDEEMPLVQPGGTAYYASVAAARLGRSVHLVTRASDAAWLSLFQVPFADLPIEVTRYRTANTTRFVNTYRRDRPDARQQMIEALAEGFERRDVEPFLKGATWWLLGPLTPSEIPLSVIRLLGQKAAGVALDIQGCVRELRNGRVGLGSGTDVRAVLGEVVIVKAGREEALAVTGERDPVSAARRLREMGVAEVLVTLGSQGSVVAWENETLSVDAFGSERASDTTGCGDTYLASYLVGRTEGRSPAVSAALASVAAGMKARSNGALSYGRADLDHELEGFLDRVQF